MLGARVGQVIEIEAEGPEAKAALEAVAHLVERGFDEKD